ncbi:YceK/YidQ family lipoprotein [Pseudomonas aeruginosa]
MRHRAHPGCGQARGAGGLRRHPAGLVQPARRLLDLPGSALLDTLLLPFSLATAIGLNLGVSGGM